MGLAAHLRQHDHWTFLVGFVLVGTNLVVHSRAVTAAAFCFLLVAIAYDVFEYRSGKES